MIIDGRLAVGRGLIPQGTLVGTKFHAPVKAHGKEPSQGAVRPQQQKMRLRLRCGVMRVVAETKTIVQRGPGLLRERIPEFLGEGVPGIILFLLRLVVVGDVIDCVRGQRGETVRPLIVHPEPVGGRIIAARRTVDRITDRKIGLSLV